MNQITQPILVLKKELGIKTLLLVLIHVFCFKVAGQSIQGSFENKFKRYQQNESFQGTQTQVWDAVAWKGDRIHKQILVWSDVNIDGLNYEVSDLVKGTHRITASHVKLRFGQHIKGDPEARGCSAYPTHPTFIEIIDALTDVPATSLTPADPLKLWVTIDVPSTAIVGVYEGTITVNGNGTPLVFELSVTVADFTLPEVANWDFHLDLWQFPTRILNYYNSSNSENPITLWSDEHFALFEPGYKILADMGQKSITAQIKEDALGMPSMVKWIRKIDGTWEYDFSVFETYVTTLMSWGISKQISCFSPVGWNEDIIPYFDEASGAMANLSASLGSVAYNTRWNHFLTAFKIFLDEKGWFDKTVLYLDEVEQSKLSDVFSMVKNNNNAWKIGMAHTTVLSNTNSGELYDASGILGTTSTEGRSEKNTTFYTSCTQINPNTYVTPETSLAEATWMGWYAASDGLDGYLRWAFDNWRLSDPFDARDGAHTAGDFSMVYRSSNNGPIKYLPSLRGIMLRDGIQDFQKLKILKTHLAGSSDSYDQVILEELNAIVNDFHGTSGVIAERLVVKGQQAIEDIVLGRFGYCQVNGGGDHNYYVKSLTTTGGVENINFTSNLFPVNGYTHHTSSKVMANTRGSFMMNLENSPASNCARTKVWIDWNNDEDFEDEGEEVFGSGASGGCTNSASYAIPITIPSNITLGIKRIRIQVKDASESEPTACGINDKTGTIDFDLEVGIENLYCEVQGGDFLDYYIAGLTTTGGLNNQNISFAGQGFPVNGYEYHTETTVETKVGGSFAMIVQNSSESKCARTNIWIDWNSDNDFEDVGELIYSGDTSSTCENAVIKRINVQVPIHTVVGTTRMRIRTRDSYLSVPEACGIFNHTGAADFNINIKKKKFE